MTSQKLNIAYANTDEEIAQHGGNLSWVAARYPNAPRPLIDLSTGINPYAYPLPEIKPEWLHRLPDSAEMALAQDAAAKYYGAGHIALAAGMQPLIVALATLRLKEWGESDVAVLAPCYSEHGNVWQAMGHRVQHVHQFDELARKSVAIVVNPNNPDGKHYAPEQLLQLAKQLTARDGWLIVDESFGDLMPHYSMAALCTKAHNIVVLKSCGKFFGMAGLRISSAIGSRKLVEWLGTVLGPWPISTAACCLLPAMLADKAWIENTHERLAEESARWRDLLATQFTIVGYTDLFTLVETHNASEWHEYLASQGLLVRKFDYNSRWLRLGLPDQQHMERIGAMLKTL